MQRPKIQTIQLEWQGFCWSNIPGGLGGPEDMQQISSSFYKFKYSLFQALNINSVIPSPALLFPHLQPPAGSGFTGIILPYFLVSKDRPWTFPPDIQPFCQKTNSGEFTFMAKLDGIMFFGHSNSVMWMRIPDSSSSVALQSGLWAKQRSWTPKSLWIPSKWGYSMIPRGTGAASPHHPPVCRVFSAVFHTLHPIS